MQLAKGMECLYVRRKREKKRERTTQGNQSTLIGRLAIRRNSEATNMFMNGNKSFYSIGTANGIISACKQEKMLVIIRY